MTSKQRRNSRTKNGIKISEVGKRRRLEADFTLTIGAERIRFRRYSPFETRAETQAWAEKQRAAILEQAGRPQPTAAMADPTAPRSFDYWARRWLEDAANPGRVNGRNREATVESKEIIVRRHFMPAFGRRMITKLDDVAVEEYIRRKLVDDELAETTVALHLRQLRSLLGFAKRRGTPVERALELPENIALRRPKKAREAATLSEGETNSLLERTREEPRLHAFTTILFRQGARVGEVQALRWSDIDLERGTILIARSWARRRFGPTKGGKPRLVPLHPDVLTALEELPSAEPWALLFPGRDAERPASISSFVDPLREIVADLDLRDGDGAALHLTTKVGRHSLGRQWAERGLPLRSLQDLLGHSSLQITEIYMQWSSDETAQHLRQIGGRQVTVYAERLRALGVDEALLARAGMLDS